jgi:putative oxidoreductase
LPLVTAHVDQGFFVNEGGFELVLPLGGASLGIALMGAGRFSVDAALGVTAAHFAWLEHSRRSATLTVGTITIYR